jgi:hypothetical protein
MTISRSFFETAEPAVSAAAVRFGGSRGPVVTRVPRTAMYPHGDKHFIAQRDVSPMGFLERGYRSEETPRAAMTRGKSVYRKPGASSRG